MKNMQCFLKVLFPAHNPVELREQLLCVKNIPCLREQT